MFHQPPQKTKLKPGFLKNQQTNKSQDAKASWTNWFGNNLQDLNEETRSDARG